MPAPRKVTRGTCGGCRSIRRLHARGLCRRCWNVPTVKKNAPRGWNPLSADSPAVATTRNDLFTSHAPVRLMAWLAHRIARRHGPVVAAEDVLQAGCLSLLRSARNFPPGPASLWRYGRRTVLKAMTTEARRQAASAPVLYLDLRAGTESDDDCYCRLLAGWADRSRGVRRSPGKEIPHDP